MYPTYNPYEMMDNNNGYYDNNNNNFNNFNDDYPYGMTMQGMPQMGQPGFGMETMPPMGQQPSFGMGGMPSMEQQPSFGVEATPQFGQAGGMIGTPPQFGQPSFRPPFMFPPTNVAFGLNRCLNRVTMLTIIGGNSIWYFPTSIQGPNLFGFRWSLRGWVRDVIPLSSIISFRCRS